MADTDLLDRADCDITHDGEFAREAAEKAALIRDAIQEYMLAGEKLARALERAEALEHWRPGLPMRLTTDQVAGDMAGESEMVAHSYLNKDALRWLEAE